MAKKFRLKDLLHRTSKVELFHDVIIDGEVVKNHPVGWVRVRGSQDPLYQKEIAPYLMVYKDAISDLEDEEDEIKRAEELTKITTELQVRTVTAAILEWDEEFFGEVFTSENALQAFLDDGYNHIYNQIAAAMKRQEDFLPIAST